MCFFLFLGLTFVSYADGILQLKSEDAAIVWEITIDDQAQAFESGMEIRLAAGSHTIHATAPGLEPIDSSFEIRDGVVKVLTLSSEASTLVETTDQEALRATRKTTRLVVVGRPSTVEFSVDGHSSSTPASFSIGVGSHEIVAGSLVHTFDLPEDMVTYIKIDSSAGRIYGFNMTEAQETEVVARTASREEAFDQGFKLYGQRKLLTSFPLDDWVLIVAGVVVFGIVVLCLRLRLSLRGKARHFIGKKRRLTKKLSRLPHGADQEVARRLAARLQTTIARRKRFQERLMAHISKLQAQATTVPAGEKGAKLAKRLQRRLAIASKARDMLAAADVPTPPTA
jgi:hypothetical protein